MSDNLQVQLERLVERLIEQNKSLKADKHSLEQQLVQAKEQFALSQRELSELHQLQQTYRTTLNKPRIKAQSTS